MPTNGDVGTNLTLQLWMYLRKICLDLVDLSSMPLDTVLLTPEKKSRILSLLHHIQADYQAQAQKIEWQEQLLEAKQRLIDKYEAIAQGNLKSDAKEEHQEDDNLNSSLTLDIDQSFQADLDTTKGSPTTDTAEFSSNNYACSEDATPTRFDFRSWSSLVRKIQHELSRLSESNPLRRFTQQLCRQVADLPASNEIFMLRSTLKNLQHQAQAHSSIIQELRRENDDRLSRARHKRQLNLCFQDEMVRLRTQVADLKAQHVQLYAKYNDNQQEYSYLQEDFSSLHREYEELRSSLETCKQDNTSQLELFQTKSEQQIALLQEEHKAEREALLETHRRTIDELTRVLKSQETKWSSQINRLLELIDTQEQDIATLHTASKAKSSDLEQRLAKAEERNQSLHSLIDTQKHDLAALLTAQKAQISHLEKTLVQQKERNLSLLRLIDVQEQDLGILRASSKAQISNLEQKITQQEERNQSLVASLTECQRDLEASKEEVKKYLLECESYKTVQVSLQEECQLQAKQLQLHAVLQEQAETWQMTCLEHEQRVGELKQCVASLRDELRCSKERCMPDISHLLQQHQDPASTINDEVVDKLKLVLDKRIEEYSQDQSKYPTNAPLQHYLSVEMVFLSALRGRLLLLN
ncbi:hypothetical protein AC1031_006720 [Aphanomyces cochlioides]|nr:hypothetical protein AC1031_006720 [Aphanomyces cochlioides]